MSTRTNAVAAFFISLSLLGAEIAGHGSILTARAQEAQTLPRVGILAGGAFPGSPDAPRSRWSPYYALVDGLKELGWIDGKNVVIVPKYAAGKLDRLPAMAQELVEMKVDVIVSMGGPALGPAAEATRSIPIVMVSGSADPVADGFVTSLAHPGGNITGLTWAPTPELLGKILEMVRELAPALSRFALLNDGPVRPSSWRAWSDATQRLGIQLQKFEVAERSDIEPAMVAIRRAQVQAVAVGMGAATYSYRNQVAALALSGRLLAVATARELTEAGGLLSYGPNNAVQFRRSAAYVDKILRGAKPGDLPIEQPTKFELVINLKTAKALGITIPESILLRADEVIR